MVNTMITRVHVMETPASAAEPLDLYTDSFCIALPLYARVSAVARSQRKNAAASTSPAVTPSIQGTSVNC